MAQLEALYAFGSERCSSNLELNKNLCDTSLEVLSLAC